MFRLFPLLIVPVAIYNLFALGGTVAGHHDIQELITRTFQITMFSGDPWKISFSDFLLLFGLALLFIEVVKATRTTSNELINQRIRLDIAAETKSIRELIVAQAFAEADLLDRSRSEGDYHDDPRGIAK